MFKTEKRVFLVAKKGLKPRIQEKLSGLFLGLAGAPHGAKLAGTGSSEYRIRCNFVLRYPVHQLLYVEQKKNLLLVHSTEITLSRGKIC